MPTLTKVSLWNVQSLPQFQSRAAELDEATVEEYAERYRKGLPMDPIRVCGQTHTSLVVVDGHHRLEAMKRAGFGPEHQIEVEIVNPSLSTSDVQWIAAGQNVRHGLRRTPADREKAVKMALESNVGKTDTEIAKHCDVSQQLVNSVRHKYNLLPDDHPEKDLPPPPPPAPPVQAIPPMPMPTEKPAATPPAKDAPRPFPPMPTMATVPPPPPPPPRQATPPPVPTCDRKFRPIPEELRSFYARRAEVMSVAARLTAVKEQLSKALKANDTLWCEVNAQTIASLENVIRTVEDCEPLYLCPACGGENTEGCRLCGHRGGFIGRKEYENVVKKDPTLLKYVDRAADKAAVEADNAKATEDGEEPSEE